jgi:hypothetical protein
MRQGMVFKRCCRRGAAVPGRTCQRCGPWALSWSFVVDSARVGLPRRQKKERWICNEGRGQGGAGVASSPPSSSGSPGATRS